MGSLMMTDENEAICLHAFFYEMTTGEMRLKMRVVYTRRSWGKSRDDYRFMHSCASRESRPALNL